MRLYVRSLAFALALLLSFATPVGAFAALPITDNGTAGTLAAAPLPNQAVTGNAADYKGKTVSILGDSISTFAGYIPVADGFNLEHLPRYPQDDLLTDVDETWWMQVIAGLGAKLGINDSWRGATLSGYAPVTTGTSGENAAMANLTRIANLGSNGTPDVILLYGGTNDLAHVSKIGAFDPATAPTEADLTTKKWDNLADGFIHTLLRLRHYYPDAIIVAMLPTYTASYYSDAKLAEGNAVMAAICEHYGIPCVDLRDSGVTASHLPDGIHPGAEGMDLITESVLDVLLNECEIEAGENVVYSVKHLLSGAESSLSYYKGVSANKSFVTAVTGEDLSVTVTMGGTDITSSVYADGLISIPKVTGDIVITAQGRIKPVYEEHLQELPEKVCSDTDIWKRLEHDTEYYTVDGWGIHPSGQVRSVTISVIAGDLLWATSFGKSGTNGGSMNGIRVTFFDANSVMRSMAPDQTYAEFTANGYLSAPEGAVAVNVPMWTAAAENELYILNREHDYESVVTAPTCTEKGYTTHTCECGESYVDNYVDARGYDWMLEDGEFKILLIGNSFSEDASNAGMPNSQMLDILQAMLGDDIKITVGLCYSGGKGLNWHATQSEQGNKSYSLRVISTESGKWKSLGSYTSADALEWTDWDVVSLQHYEINTTTGKESNAYPAQVDPKFDHLEAATEFMLDYVDGYAPQAAIYFYMHWARAYRSNLNESLATYNKMAEFFPVVMHYRGSESGRRFETIIPVGLSVQNARTTYLSLLSYNTTAYADGNLNLTTDAQIGLQRDGGHLSYNVGRYIAALTFAETIIPEQLRAKDYVLPEIRITESVGKLPKEYTEIAQKAVLAAVSGWKNGSLAVSNISGYEKDPTATAEDVLGGTTLALTCSANAADRTAKIKNAVLAALPEDFAVDAIRVSDDACDATVRFGYLSRTVTVSFTESAHDYNGATCTSCGAKNPNPYAGKTIACVGDSITCGVGVTKDQTDYVYLLAQQLGMDYVRLGVSGTTLCTDGSRTCNVGKLTEENLAGADVVTILMGINDFCAAGKGYYELGDINSTDTSTIYGAAHMWCQRIVELRRTESLKNTEFYFVTPVITSWNNSVSSARNWDQSKTNIHGYTLRDLCNAILEVCALYDIPVIDLNLISGLYYNSAEDNTVTEFGGDGVHPGTVGHQMMADAIESRLLQRHLQNDHDHSYGSWITTTYPDCVAGEQQRVCSVCTATEKQVLNGRGHDYENGACTACGATLGDVSGEGKLTALDLAIINAYLEGTLALKPAELSACDVNRDGSVTEDDLITLGNRILGK